MIRRRDLIIGAGVAAVAAPTITYAEETIVIKMGALKLIHSIAPYFYDRFTPAGYEVQVIPFESPADGKNAVVTKSVDFASVRRWGSNRHGFARGGAERGGCNTEHPASMCSA